MEFNTEHLVFPCAKWEKRVEKAEQISQLCLSIHFTLALAFGIIEET